jgi:hypothetical protein
MDFHKGNHTALPRAVAEDEVRSDIPEVVVQSQRIPLPRIAKDLDRGAARPHGPPKKWGECKGLAPSAAHLVLGGWSVSTNTGHVAVVAGCTPVAVFR